MDEQIQKSLQYLWYYIASLSQTKNTCGLSGWLLNKQDKHKEGAFSVWFPSFLKRIGVLDLILLPYRGFTPPAARKWKDTMNSNVAGFKKKKK